MNKYLLLRDNKQSGPYSVDQLAKHGLKPYDLVWLEGKSAAWRYPSEIDELKPFAPVVEEQPFDRFYKKAETKMQEPLAQDHTAVKQTPIFLKEEVKFPSAEKRAEQTPEIKINPSKKIHVSLPVTKSAAPSTGKLSEDKPGLVPLPVTDNPTPAPDPGPSTDLKSDVPADVIKGKSDAVDRNPNFEETYRKNKQHGQEKNIARTHPATVSKLLFRTVTAACLLLGGALIGLIINYNNQQKKFQQLNQLVQEIRHQENTAASMPVRKETTDQDLNTTEEQSSKEQPVYVEDLQIPVEKKDTKHLKAREQSPSSVLTDTQVHEVETPPIVQPEEPSPKTEKVSPELARKNLWQLVSVDHNKFKTGVFGGISNLELKISNKSLYQLEKVEVEIKYMGPEKKVVNTQTVIFENVSPGEQLSLQVPKSSRGVQIDYSIKKINTKELGLAHAGM